MASNKSDRYRALVASLAVALLATQQVAAVIVPDKSPMSLQRLSALFAENPSVRTLDQVPAILPPEFRINFTLKHGVLRTGERGHLVERVVSQSSEPLAPRAIVWDERSGFVVSYNGGAAHQTANQRLDVRSFDPLTKKFSLVGADFPIAPGRPEYKMSDCTSCHGNDHRPIFSMYPDWPSFYGSDNDELTDFSKAVQAKENSDYQRFRDSVAPRHPRYAPLFDRNSVRTVLGVDLYPTFPYRQNIDGNYDANLNSISRSFAFRPSLRLGVLLNRLQGQAITKKVVDHPRYSQFGSYFLHQILECRWPTNAQLSERNQWRKRNQFVESVGAALGENLKTVEGGTLHYRQLLKLFNLTVNDVDIRYSYNHAGYANDDASKKVMEVGYIGSYWNSYFDGSATIDELIAWQLYSDLVRRPGFESLRGIIRPVGLESKYQGRAARFAFDKNFFQEMDRKGQWIPIPYPSQLTAVHHREGYPAQYSTQHNQVCRSLESIFLK